MYRLCNTLSVSFPLGLRDKTLFKHGEFYEIVFDDRRL